MVKDPGGKTPSSWRTHRLCLEAIPDDATHLLCLQDDAWPCDGFAGKALAAITEKPDRIIAFFVPGVSHLTRRVNLERKRGSRWLEFPSISFVPLVAVVYPAELARQIVPFAEQRRIGPRRADDAVVGEFARAHRITACATIPSLVEHLDAAPSVMRMPHGRGQPHRLAAFYVET